MPAPVLLDTSPTKDSMLLTRATERGVQNVQEVHVTPTIRLGMSGTRVYRVRAKLDGSRWSRYFYAKVGNIDRLRFEHDAYRRYVQGQIPQVTEAWFLPMNHLACLCCFTAGVSHVEPTPLVDLLEQPFQIPTSRICEALDRIYGMLLIPWREASEDVEIAWFDEYSWHLRWIRTESFLRSWLGYADCEKKTFSLGPQRFVSPLNLICRARDEAWSSKVRRRPTHGDLHQRNIIIDRIGEELNPWLIDFGWTRVLHSLVDYALLEASLKMFFFARFFSEDRYLQLHDLLHNNSRSIKRYRTGPEEAMLNIIQAIRNKAREEVYSYEAWPREYYLASLFVSLGLITIPTGLPRMAWLTSAWFATQIGQQQH